LLWVALETAFFGGGFTEPIGVNGEAVAVFIAGIVTNGLAVGAFGVKFVAAPAVVTELAGFVTVLVVGAVGVALATRGGCGTGRGCAVGVSCNVTAGRASDDAWFIGVSGAGVTNLTVPSTGAGENFQSSFWYAIDKAGIIGGGAPAGIACKGTTIGNVNAVAVGVSGEGFFGLAVVHDRVDTSDSADGEEEDGNKTGNDFFVQFAFWFKIS